MGASHKYWLLLEKSDETRISKGIDGYQDKTGESYHYDSLVPNHKNLRSGDLVVLRKENLILGVGKIGTIEEIDDVKIHRRCPDCKSTDIRERKNRSPKWKCGKCAHEFSSPEKTNSEVRSYTANIQGFTQLNSPPSVKDVKRCSIISEGASSQLSIIQLDRDRILNLLEGVDIYPSSRNPQLGEDGQGFGLSQAERKSVEGLAMRVARELYESDGWKVVDKSSSHSFDLLATKDGQRRFVEVKGTTGKGSSIILTHAEVEHVRHHRNESVLVVVTDINLEYVNNQWAATGGKISVNEHPWCIRASQLQATQYRYVVLHSTAYSPTRAGSRVVG
jgi:ribosomal protein L37AE/L43A